MDPVQERIGELLRAHDAGSKYLHRSLFTNIAFLVKHVAGPKVKPYQVSITYTMASYAKDYVGDTMTVLVHKSAGEVKVVVDASVDDGTEILEALDTKVATKVDEFLGTNGMADVEEE